MKDPHQINYSKKTLLSGQLVYYNRLPMSMDWLDKNGWIQGHLFETETISVGVLAYFDNEEVMIIQLGDCLELSDAPTIFKISTESITRVIPQQSFIVLSE